MGEDEEKPPGRAQERDWGGDEMRREKETKNAGRAISRPARVREHREQLHYFAVA